METYISILRGTNVSGQKKILMKDLKTLFEELSFKKVRTYIQSGNIVFEYDKTDNKCVSEIIGNKISKKYGSSGMFWEFFIGRDKGLIPRSGRRYRF